MKNYKYFDNNYYYAMRMNSVRTESRKEIYLVNTTNAILYFVNGICIKKFVCLFFLAVVSTEKSQLFERPHYKAKIQAPG